MKPLETLKKINEAYQKVKLAQLEYENISEKLEAECEHEWKYESDPSGNNDSGYSCLCGAWNKNSYKKS